MFPGKGQAAARRGFGWGASLFGGEGSEEVAVDLNLTPLMDVMSNILFFLLASFGAAIVSYLGVSVPVQADAPGPPPPAAAVTVNLRIDDAGFRLGATGEGVAPERLAALARKLPRREGVLDAGGLAAALLEVKREFPASDTLVIVPSRRTSYEELVLTMDASREARVESGRVRLFPKVVVAELVGETAAEEGP